MTTPNNNNDGTAANPLDYNNNMNNSGNNDVNDNDNNDNTQRAPAHEKNPDARIWIGSQNVRGLTSGDADNGHLASILDNMLLGKYALCLGTMGRKPLCNDG